MENEIDFYFSFSAFKGRKLLLFALKKIKKKIHEFKRKTRIDFHMNNWCLFEFVSSN